MARHFVGYFLDSGYLPYGHQFSADVTVKQPARQASHPTTKGLNLILRCLTFGATFRQPAKAGPLDPIASLIFST